MDSFKGSSAVYTGIMVAIFKNHCIPGHPSTCGAGQKWSGHSSCKYSKKATFASRCMFFKFDEFCDCLNAQLENEKLGQESG